MRKILAAWMGLVMMIVCSSCNSGVYVEQENIHVNYNNKINGGAYFWLSENAIYYPHAPFYTIHYYQKTANGTKKLLSANSADYAKIQEYDGVLYLLNSYDYSSPERSYCFRTFDLNTQEMETIAYIEGSSDYFVLDGYAYFVTHCGGSTYRLDAISLKTHEKFTIFSSVVCAGVMNGKVVYLVKEYDRYVLYSFDTNTQTSTCMDDYIDREFSERFDYQGFNFTSKQVVFVCMDWHDNTTNIVTYDLQSKEICEYTQDLMVYELVAYENYAFFVGTTEFEGDSNLQKNDIFRICLSDGTVEKLGEMNGWVELYVTSDDDVYVNSTASVDEIYHYHCDGTKELAFTT